MSKLNFEDSWALTAILKGNRKTGSNLRQIISTGDYINRCIFDYEIFSESLRKLEGYNLIRISKGKMFATEFARTTLQHIFDNRTKDPHGCIGEVLVELEKTKLEYSQLSKGSHFSKNEFKDAYDEYHANSMKSLERLHAFLKQKKLDGEPGA